jgi:hypothetical protein
MERHLRRVTVERPLAPRRVLRRRSVGTKVTDDEYASLEAMAGSHALSEWVRDTLLRAAAPDWNTSTLLAELLALRTIVLNLHFALCSGESVSADTMQRLIERADQEKAQRARERLTPRRNGGLP